MNDELNEWLNLNLNQNEIANNEWLMFNIYSWLLFSSSRLFILTTQDEEEEKKHTLMHTKSDLFPSISMRNTERHEDEKKIKQERIKYKNNFG